MDSGLLEENDIEGKILVEELIYYAKMNLGLKLLDEIYVRNILLNQFSVDESIKDLDYTSVDLTKPDYLVQKIESYALRKGIADNEKQFSAYIFGILSPLPSVVNQNFYDIKESKGIKEAEKYFYDLCVKNNYIQKTAIDKNIKWQVKDNNKRLEITINLSKPEKNNKDIAKLLVKTNSSYPNCPLCKENEGFKGNSKIQPRTNLRTVSLKINNEDWFSQYSPYGYYNEHIIAICNEHRKMNVALDTISKLFDFIKVFDDYFIGCNASLPYIGGSILNHEHFQGGKHRMPLFDAPFKQIFEAKEYPDLKIGIVDWYNSVVRIEGENKDNIILLGSKFVEQWKEYENKELFIINQTGEEKHNSLSPILHKEGNKYILDLILRNNIRTEEFPEGYFHAHPEYHNIKKEGIGLIEAMGLFILPARLKNQLSLVSKILCGEMPYSKEEISNEDNYLYVHRDMIEYLVNNFDCKDYDVAKNIVKERVNFVCKNILLNTAVFKNDEKGNKAFENFVKSTLNKQKL